VCLDWALGVTLFERDHRREIAAVMREVYPHRAARG